jgi:inhibitor of cysteine peptidase
MKSPANFLLALVATAAMAVLAACVPIEPATPAASEPIPTSTSAPAETPTEAPTETAAQPAEPQADEIAPGEGGQVYVDSIDVLTLESFPVQVNAVVSGALPDPCTEITGATAQLNDSTFTVEITTTRPPDAICAQVLAPFEVTVPLDVSGLPAGEYTVSAGEVQTTFNLAVDNVPPADAAGGETATDETEVSETDVEFVMANEDVPMYDGPGETNTEIGFVAGGMTAAVTGVSADGLWWRVICPDGTEGDCWISADPQLTQPTTAP